MENNVKPMPEQTRSRATRILHALIAVTIVTQLALSTVMQAPGRNRPGDQWFEVHEYVGLATLAVLAGYWIWAMVRTREVSFAMLFPWFSMSRIRNVWADLGDHLRSLGRGKLPLSEAKPLANAVHGLGLIVATIMAVTGAAGYFLPQARSLLDVHAAVSSVMWAYLIGHAGIAVLHEIKGERLIQRIFTFAKR